MTIPTPEEALETLTPEERARLEDAGRRLREAVDRFLETRRPL